MLFCCFLELHPCLSCFFPSLSLPLSLSHSLSLSPSRRYYADIRQTISASDQEMNSALAELSHVCYSLLFSSFLRITFFNTLTNHLISSPPLFLLPPNRITLLRSTARWLYTSCISTSTNTMIKWVQNGCWTGLESIILLSTCKNHLMLIMQDCSRYTVIY